MERSGETSPNAAWGHPTLSPLHAKWAILVKEIEAERGRILEAWHAGDRNAHVKAKEDWQPIAPALSRSGRLAAFPWVDWPRFASW